MGICFSKLNGLPYCNKKMRKDHKMFIRQVPFGITQADIQRAWCASGHGGKVTDVEIRQKRTNQKIPPRHAFVSVSSEVSCKESFMFTINGFDIKLEPRKTRNAKTN